MNVKCPETGEIKGCGSMIPDERDDEGFVDCPNCGLFFKPVVVNQLCIRDPDYENHFVSDGEINVIEIDVGASWFSYKDFAACLREGQADALEYEQGVLDEVKHLPADNVVRQGVEEFFATAREE